MGSFLRAFFLAAPVVAALACGGRVDGIGNNGGGSCPPPAGVQDGFSCSESGQSCASDEPGCGGPLYCTCSGGSWSCVAPPCPPPPVCPTTVTVGSTCTASQEGCAAPATVDGCGTQSILQCECEQGSWVCEGAIPFCPDAQACPSPSAVQEGFACDVASGTSCQTDDPIIDCEGDVTGYVSCVCAGGRWTCPFTPGQNCQDAGGPCPQPVDVVMDTACSTDGQQCPGNPQVCGGQVLYDAFECEQGLWEDVAVTDCDLDAGQ